MTPRAHQHLTVVAERREEREVAVVEPRLRDLLRVGLVLFGLGQDQNRPGSRFRIRDESIFRRVKQRMRDWFYGEFE